MEAAILSIVVVAAMMLGYIIRLLQNITQILSRAEDELKKNGR